MKMKSALLPALVLALLLCACTTSKSATFSVDTGDRVKVTVNTTEGLDLVMQVPFSVTREGRELLTGSFAVGSYYDTCREAVEEEPQAVILEEGTKDGGDYFFYTVDGASGVEYDYVVRVDGSQTVVLLGSLAGREEAEEAFREIVFSLD